jgi:nitroreductase
VFIYFGSNQIYKWASIDYFMQLVNAIKARKSTKRFSGKVVDWRKIIQALEATRFAPMAGDMYSLKFILVQEKQKLDKIAKACQQDFTQDASAFVVVVSDRNKVKKMYDYNGKGFAEQQAGAAIQNFLLALTEKKIEHCWIGFFDDSLAHEAVSVPKEYFIEAMIAIGVGSKAVSSNKKIVPELDNIIYFDNWSNKRMEQESKIRHEYS